MEKNKKQLKQLTSDDPGFWEMLEELSDPESVDESKKCEEIDEDVNWEKVM